MAHIFAHGETPHLETPHLGVSEGTVSVGLLAVIRSRRNRLSKRLCSTSSISLGFRMMHSMRMNASCTTMGMVLRLSCVFSQKSTCRKYFWRAMTPSSSRSSSCFSVSRSLEKGERRPTKGTYGTSL